MSHSCGLVEYVLIWLNYSKYDKLICHIFYYSDVVFGGDDMFVNMKKGHFFLLETGNLLLTQMP